MYNESDLIQKISLIKTQLFSFGIKISLPQYLKLKKLKKDFYVFFNKAKQQGYWREDSQVAKLIVVTNDVFREYKKSFTDSGEFNELYDHWRSQINVNDLNEDEIDKLCVEWLKEKRKSLHAKYKEHLKEIESQPENKELIKKIVLVTQKYLKLNHLIAYYPDLTWPYTLDDLSFEMKAFEQFWLILQSVFDPHEYKKCKFKAMCAKRNELKRKIICALAYQLRPDVQSPLINLEQESKYEKLILCTQQYLIYQQELSDEFAGFHDVVSHHSTKLQEIIPKLQFWQKNSNKDLLLKQCRLDKEFYSWKSQCKNPQLTVDQLMQNLTAIKEEFENFLLDVKKIPRIIQLLNNHNKVLQDITDKFNRIAAFIRQVKEGKKVFTLFNLRASCALGLPEYNISLPQQQELYDTLSKHNRFCINNINQRCEKVQTNSSRFTYILVVSTVFRQMLCDHTSWGNGVSVIITMFRVSFDAWNLRMQTLALEQEYDNSDDNDIKRIFTILEKNHNEHGRNIAIKEFIDGVVDEKTKKLKALELASRQQLKLQIFNASLAAGQTLALFFLLSAEQRSSAIFVTHVLSLCIDEISSLIRSVRRFLPKKWPRWSLFSRGGLSGSVSNNVENITLQQVNLSKK